MKINVAFDSLEEFQQFFIAKNEQETVSAEIVKFPAQEPAKEEVAPAPEAVNEEAASAPAPEPEPVREEEKILSVTLEELQKLCFTVMNQGQDKQQALLELLHSFGVNLVPDLNDSQRTQFYVEVQKMLEV